MTQVMSIGVLSDYHLGEGTAERCKSKRNRAGVSIVWPEGWCVNIKTLSCRIKIMVPMVLASGPGQRRAAHDQVDGNKTTDGQPCEVSFVGLCNISVITLSCF